MVFFWVDSRSTPFDNVVYGRPFSYTKNDLGYATNQDMVADGLYETLKQFYTLFPDLLQSDLFITGESYAGTIFTINLS